MPTYCIVTMGSYGETAMEVVDASERRRREGRGREDTALETVPFRGVPQGGAGQEVSHRDRPGR
ncbi:MAG: hypothetical protein MZU79_09085 [Anaerotruncus sp.]|nr:hypothetical protein [Anaerotruncus sp.]